ncbi:MAG: pyruvate kinase [Alphaproteobacteria bacterium]
MMRQRRAKIVATLGPASSDERMIRALFEAGVDVYRLNFSHGEPDEHRARVDAIRAVEQAVARPIAILADLQGPKLRLGTFEAGKASLNPGARFRLDLDRMPGDAARAPLPHPEIFAALRPGTEVLLDDGRIRLRVDSNGPDHAETTVLVGGEISNRKGVNLPRISLPLSSLTEKDRRDLHFALDLGVDWIALSFVQRPEDVAEARKLIQGRANVMTKLEKPAALDRLDEIIELSDALMVARGDLGVELDPEDVPIEQKRIVRDCRRAGKPVVVATQMLESMVRAPAPTRAEASDVATAVFDGVDAVMLSAETAAGAYPREAVAMMNRIIERVERDDGYRRQLQSTHADPEATAADAITAAAAQVAQTIKAACIVTYTTSGSTALRAARERPPVPVLALTPTRATARRLALTWGVHCVETEDARSFTEMVEKASRVAVEQGIAKPGDRLVVTAGVPFGTPGATNVLRIAWVEG